MVEDIQTFNCESTCIKNEEILPLAPVIEQKVPSQEEEKSLSKAEAYPFTYTMAIYSSDIAFILP